MYIYDVDVTYIDGTLERYTNIVEVNIDENGIYLAGSDDRQYHIPVRAYRQIMYKAKEST